ncbi:hypothetical protein SAY87_004121 [Trapa incisa]|uniref:Uncharacterized protein n=1 Tax=Trapa incisa TaxID=236973 RepID=A0AAN7JNG5_9MYRT|nr:hypothetical protein SAY87_004121 [Trapa incisa]
MTAPNLLLVHSRSSPAGQDRERNHAPPPRHGRETEPVGERGVRSSRPPAQKRQPQRGLGVAQLERLRLQDLWKNTTHMPHQLRRDFQTQTRLLGSRKALITYPCLSLCGEGGLAVQRRAGFVFPLGSGQAVGSMNMAGVRGGATAVTPVIEVPRELSSMPNVRCFPGRYHKYSTLDATARAIAILNRGAGDHISNGESTAAVYSRDFLALNLGNGLGSRSSGGYFAPGDHEDGTQHAIIHQDVEGSMVAGRKVKTVGRDNLLMEYEFFPGKSDSCKGNLLEKMCIPTEGYEAMAASGFAPENDSGSGAGESSRGEGQNSIDLSLSLSR